MGLILPDASNPFFAELAHATERAAARLGYALLICNTSDSAADEAGSARWPPRTSIREAASTRRSPTTAATVRRATSSPDVTARTQSWWPPTSKRLASSAPRPVSAYAYRTTSPWCPSTEHGRRPSPIRASPP
nr:hypothetical protein [Plantactinospora mayteni]